jgi:hypothetical protein
MRRCNHIGDPTDPRYEYRFPLIELGWDRERCIDKIRREGWPVPHKSSCFFCPSIQRNEVLNLPPDQLRGIALMEPRAKRRLTKIEGLWRKTRKRANETAAREPSRRTFVSRSYFPARKSIESYTRSRKG